MERSVPENQSECEGGWGAVALSHRLLCDRGEAGSGSASGGERRGEESAGCHEPGDDCEREEQWASGGSQVRAAHWAGSETACAAVVGGAEEGHGAAVFRATGFHGEDAFGGEPAHRAEYGRPSI